MVAAAIGAGTPQPTLTAVTYIASFATASRPARMTCSDGRVYVIKGAQNGFMLATEQVVAALGRAIGAPVPDTALIDVSAALVGIEPQIAHFAVGLGHGSAWIDDVTDREGFRYFDQAANRSRFASLGVLYSWMGANDHQFIYQKQPPHLVYSVDHGHFIPGGPNWTSASLAGAPAATMDPNFNGCALTSAELKACIGPLQAVSDQQIANAVAAPPANWGVGVPERVALAAYLARRRDEMLTVLNGLP
jgi:hypothetical protein